VLRCDEETKQQKTALDKRHGDMTKRRIRSKARRYVCG
jgi:hypothetical protein